jgi:hypothetical protein
MWARVSWHPVTDQTGLLIAAALHSTNPATGRRQLRHTTLSRSGAIDLTGIKPNGAVEHFDVKTKQTTNLGRGWLRSAMKSGSQSNIRRNPRMQGLPEDVPTNLKIKPRVVHLQSSGPIAGTKVSQTPG